MEKEKMSQNKRLIAKSALWREAAEALQALTGKKQRVFACAVAIRNGLTGSHPRCMKSHGRDGGIMALRSLPAGAGSKPPRAALAEDRCRERRGKRRTHVVRQVWIKKANTSEPPYRRRYAYNDIKTGSANSPGTSP